MAAATMEMFPMYSQSGTTSSAFPYLWCSLGFTVCMFAWERYLDLRQYLRLTRCGHLVPEALKSCVLRIDSELLRKLEDKVPATQAYALDKARFKFVSVTYSLVQSVALCLLGAHAFAWDLCAGTFGLGEIATSLLFIGCFVLFDTVASLPLELYSTFVIEQKHGFNKTTAKLFIIDKVKSLALTALIGSPIMAALLALIRAVGPQYLAAYVGSFTLAVSLFLLTIFPMLQGLFNKFEEIEDGPLRSAIEGLATSVGYPLYKLFKVDGSKRSGHSNAYLFGFFKFKRIVIYDTLLSQATIDEVVAVLAHELGHWAHSHTVRNFVITQLYTFAAFTFFAMSMSNADLYRSFGFYADENAAGSHTAGAPVVVGLFLFFNTLWEPVDHLLSFLLTLNSRKMEREADRYAADLGKHDALQRGLVKITFENLGVLDPDPWYSSYHHSHPTLLERIKAIDAAKQKSD